MDPDEIIANLRDIHLPDVDPSILPGNMNYWPMFFVVCSWGLASMIVWYRRRLWQRETLALLATIEDLYRSSEATLAWSELARLLRRLMMLVRGKKNVAGITGERWLRELDEVFGCNLFSRGCGRGLLDYPYQSHDGSSGHDEEFLELVAVLKERIASLRIDGYSRAP